MKIQQIIFSLQLEYFDKKIKQFWISNAKFQKKKSESEKRRVYLIVRYTLKWKLHFHCLERSYWHHYWKQKKPTLHLPCQTIFPPTHPFLISLSLPFSLYYYVLPLLFVLCIYKNARRARKRWQPRSLKRMQQKWATPPEIFKMEQLMHRVKV